MFTQARDAEECQLICIACVGLERAVRNPGPIEQQQRRRPGETSWLPSFLPSPSYAICGWVGRGRSGESQKGLVVGLCGFIVHERGISAPIAASFWGGFCIIDTVDLEEYRC